ncbi:hypothetical protein FKM82_009614 [Ascaphus truei]
MSSKQKTQPAQGVTKFFSPSQKHAEGAGKSHDGAGTSNTRGTRPQAQDRDQGEDSPNPEATLTQGMMKNMLDSLHVSIQSDLRAAVTELRQEITGLTERTTALEVKMGETHQAQSVAENEIFRLGREINTLKDTLEDHENRDRRQNIRLRGIPESVLPGQLQAYLTDLFTSLCADLEVKDLEMDRAHRTLGPRSNDPNRTRDVIARLHRYTVKEKIMQASRAKEPITFRDDHLQVYNDLSKITVDKRRDLQPLTRLMRDQGIKYKWGFPFKLIVNRNGKFLTIRHPTEMTRLAKAVGLDPPPAWDSDTSETQSRDADEGPCLVHTITGDLLRALEGPENCLYPRLISVSSEGHCIIYYERGRFCNFSINGKLLGQMEINDSTRAILLSSDGQNLVTGGDNGVVEVWQACDFKQLYIYPGCDAGIRAMDLSHDQRTLITGMASGSIVAFNIDFNRWHYEHQNRY